MSRFGTLLRKERTKSKLTLRELAQRTGLSPMFICDVELGRRWPSSGNLDKINLALGSGLKIAEFRCKTCGMVRRD